MKSFITSFTLIFSYLLLSSNLYAQPNQTAVSPCTVSLDFDGVDDYINAKNLVPGNVDLTVEAWFLSEDDDGKSGCVSNFERILGFGGTRFELGECAGVFTFFSETSGALSSSVNTLDGQWHHAAATKQGNNLVVYLDGVQVITHTFATSVQLNDRLWVGQWNTTQLRETWDGKIDEVRVWDYARSMEEILNTKDNCLAGDETGLITYYTFNQGSPEEDNTTLSNITDLSPSANHGTFNNFNLTDNSSNFVGTAPFDGSCDPACASAQNLVSLDFDGKNDYINAKNLVPGNVDLTVEAWFLSEDGDGASGCVSNFERILGFGGTRFELGECAGVFTFFSETSGALSSSINTLDGLWHHAAATKQGNDLVVYLDGVPVITHTFATSIELNDRFWVGQWNTTQLKETWDGKMDEVRVWNYARSQAEILSTKNTCLVGNEAGLITYYNFNQGTAEGNNENVSAIIDLCPSGNHGVLNNFSLTGSNSNFVSPSPLDANCTRTAETTVSIVNEITKPTNFKAYPNPFNHQLTIDFELDERAFSNIKLYDFSGKQIEQIVQPQNLSAGKHQMEISLDNLPAGLYFIHVALGNNQFSKSVIKN